MKPTLIVILLTLSTLSACTRVDEGLATRTLPSPVQATAAPEESGRLPVLPPISPDADTREIMDYN